MKKEKTIRTYQRRTKSGKVVTVKQHTAKYDAADRAKEMASKKGAGEELATKKGMPDHNLPMNEYLAELKKMRENPEETPMEQETKKSSPSAEKKSKSVKSTKTTKSAATTQANGVSASDFKSWYHFNDWDKPKKSWPAEVRAADAAIRKQLGSKKAYDDYCAQIDGSYSKSGHNKAFKSFGGAATSMSAKSSPKVKSGEISKESATKSKESKPVRAPKNESQKQREARWNRGQFTDVEKSMAIEVYDLSGSKNNLHPKLSAWAKKEIKRMDDERAAKVDTKILKGLDRGVVSKLATLQGKKKLSKEDEAFIDKHVAPSGLIRGTRVSAFDAISAHKKDSDPPFSKSPVDTGSTKGNLKRAVAEGRITQAMADAIMGKKSSKKR